MKKMKKMSKEVRFLKTRSSMFGASKSYPKYLMQDYDVRSTEDTLIDGRIVKGSKTKTIHPADKFKGLKPNDFALENIIAVGAFDSLKECYLSNNNLENVSNIDSQVANMEVALDNELNEGGNE